MPKKNAIEIATAPTWSETCAPWMMRASVSRPISSVPIGCAQVGARNRSDAGSLGSSVQIKRPKRAVRTAPPTMTAPAMPIGLRQRAGSTNHLRSGTAFQTPSTVLMSAAHVTLILGSR